MGSNGIAGGGALCGRAPRGMVSCASASERSIVQAVSPLRSATYLVRVRLRLRFRVRVRVRAHLAGVLQREQHLG